jgi:Ca-activated chloride channel family protein
MIRALTPKELADLVTDGDDAGFGALATEKGCLPLRALDVAVRIDGLSAATTVRQQFVNVFDGPLEATYIFPLPPRAAVIGFRMLVDGAEIRGRIDERGQARHDYATAVAEGRHAAIVEEERPDVFTLRVGNIPARSAARVEFTLVAPVTIDTLEATYRFPLVVAPRYCPGEMLDGDQAGDGITLDTDLLPDASRISPPILLPGMKSPVRLGIAVHIAPGTVTGSSADAVGCSLPASDVVDEAGFRTITVLPDQHLDRDFILRWTVGDEAAVVTAAQFEPDAERPAGLGTGAAVADAPGDGTFTVSIVPPVSAALVHEPRDVVFLLDRSGSMGGWQIVAARRAVARIIDSLSADDRVAVIAFDDRIEHGADAVELMAATDRNRWRLLEWLAIVEARGGTRLAPAIEAGLSLCGATAKRSPSDAARSPCVVLVTDAQVGNEDQVLRSLTKNLGEARLFVVGIDNAVNEGLISRLADASGGLVELVESEDRLDEVLERIQVRIQPPLVHDLQIVGDGIELIPESIVPGRMPDLVAGLPLVLRGRYRSAMPGATVRIAGTHAAGEPWHTSAAVAHGATPGLGSLWARGMLRQLEDRRVTGSVPSWSAYSDVAAEEEDATLLDARIVQLSMSFGVLCRLTALVAIDGRRPDEQKPTMQPRRVVQPVRVFSRSTWIDSVQAFACHSEEFPALLATPALPMSSPPAWDEQGEDFFGMAEVDAPDSLAAARAAAARLLAKARPRSGRLADVSGRQVNGLLGGMLKLMRQTGKCGHAAEAVEQFAAAYARLYATPRDRDLLAELLELLASFAEGDGVPGPRWWLENPRPLSP